MHKLTFAISLAIIFITALVINAYKQSENVFPTIIFCDVGQGDAALITLSGFQILIDAGKGKKILKCLEEQMPFWDKQIEIFIGSHNDDDHVAGLNYILPKYRINNFFMSDDLEANLKEKIDKYGIIPEKISIGDAINISNTIKLQVVHPGLSETLLSDINPKLAKYKKDENNGSIVLLLDVQGVRVLFTGDIDSTVEQALIAKGLIGDIDVLKVAHHGSKKGTSSDFLRIISPEIAVISCGENNVYKHPSEDVVRRLEASQVDIYQTDILGRIIIKIINYDNYLVLTERVSRLELK